MSNKTIFTLLFLVLASMGILFAFNLSSIYGKKTKENFMPLNEISGMATLYHDKLYTLNFEQQTKAAATLNQAVKIEKEQLAKIGPSHFDYSALIIYRFEKEPVTLKPVGLINKQLLFQTDSQLFRETGPGVLHQLLSETYDTPQHVKNS